MSDPIRVDRVPAALGAPAGWTGRLGMTFLPGKRGRGLTTVHARDLGQDLRDLRDRWETDLLVLLPEDHELANLQVPTIVTEAASAGIRVVRHPVRDVDLPTDDAAYRALLDELHGELRTGRNVVVACVGGLGRTGTLVGCLLRDAGLGGAEAVAATRAARPGTIETAAQARYVRDWPGRLPPPI
jgi:hypothetical protein